MTQLLLHRLINRGINPGGGVCWLLCAPRFGARGLCQVWIHSELVSISKLRCTHVVTKQKPDQGQGEEDLDLKGRQWRR